MGCTDSNKGKCFQTISSNCVEWVGDDIPLLGIGCGDSITEVEQAIITKLEAVMDGTGITLSDLTFDCDFISTQMAGKDKTLDIIIQMLINSACTLKDLIQTLDNEVNAPITYDPKCLGTGTYTTSSLLQAAVNEVCDLKTQVDNLTAQLQNGDLEETIKNVSRNLLNTTITSGGGYGITRTGSGDNFTMRFYAMVPPNCPIFCQAPLNNFDSSGKGLDNTAYEGWYICNGLNTTYDMRGWTPAGATYLPGINGIPLNSTVDPTLDPTIGSSIYDKRGEVKHQITVNEMPSHSHSATDSGHTHSLNISGGFQPAGNSGGPSVPTNTAGNSTNTGYAQITIGSTGGNQKIDLRQPTAYGYFIVRLG